MESGGRNKARSSVGVAPDAAEIATMAAIVLARLAKNGCNFACMCAGNRWPVMRPRSVEQRSATLRKAASQPEVASGRWRRRRPPR